MRCLRKLRCFSTPHASLTALVIAPKTPSDDQISARLPATPTCIARLAKRVELRGDEVELCREIAEDERQDRQALVLVGGDRSEQRDDQQEKREEREQRVIGDGGRVREVVAVDQLDESAPGGMAREAELRARRRSVRAGVTLAL